MNRNVEFLFWAGRYLERAEHYARVINAYYHKRYRSHETEVESEWEKLMFALGDAVGLKAAHSHMNEGTVMHYLTFERTNANSILSSLQQARSNLRALRQLLPDGLWEVINTCYLWLKDHDVNKVFTYPPYKFYKRTCEQLSLFNGIAEASMVRDQNWNFLQAGKSFERMRNTISMIRHSCGQLLQHSAASEQDWRYHQCQLLLKSCGGYEAFRQFHADKMNLDEAAYFLLHNAEFPRSVRYAISSLESCMEMNLPLHHLIEHLSHRANMVPKLIRSSDPDVMNLLQQMLDCCNMLSLLIAEDCFSVGEAHSLPKSPVLINE
ncbi:alpha-E domain-containing protein [Paenibacillus albus]|nr:alpha-E domain-containing protein [Paenibacillus albus]